MLVQATPGDNNNGRPEELVGMYEAAAARAARRTPAPGAEVDDMTKENGDVLHQSLSMAHAASVLCPFYGVVRVGATAAGRGTFRACGPTAGEQGTRLYLALGDPREGMRCPCALTIKMETALSTLPPQVRTTLASLPQPSWQTIEAGKLGTGEGFRTI